jgi:hypothetical protein
MFVEKSTIHSTKMQDEAGPMGTAFEKIIMMMH